MNDILGKWVMDKGQPFPGLWFEFKSDGSYQAELPGLVKIKSGGKYVVSEGGLIDMDQEYHTMGMIGKFPGRYQVDGKKLRMAVTPVPNGPRPDDLANARSYTRE